MNNQNQKIILIEDDISLLRMYSVKLRKEGLTVLTAETGKKALEMLKEETPSIILLDLLLPDIGGLEVLEEIKKDMRLKKIPVIILTVLPEIIALKKALKLGASGYLVKSEMTPESVYGHIKAELNKISKKNG